MQPYLDPTRKKTKKNWKTTSKKNGKKWKTTSKKMKMEDDLNFFEDLQKNEKRPPKKRRLPQKKEKRKTT